LLVDGPALPSKDAGQFNAKVLSKFTSDYESAKSSDQVSFFDRGIPDSIAYSKRFGVDTASGRKAAEQHRYSQKVFILRPWKEIFIHDQRRGKSFEEYQQFHDLIVQVYTALGYILVDVPLISIESRVKFIESKLAVGGL